LFDRYGQDHGSSTDWRADGTYTMQDDGLFKDFGFGVRAAKRNAASIKSYEGSVAPVGTVSAASLQGMSCTAQMQNNWGTTSWYTPCADYLISNTAACARPLPAAAPPKRWILARTSPTKRRTTPCTARLTRAGKLPAFRSTRYWACASQDRFGPAG
jgi:hypothetical protein